MVQSFLYALYGSKSLILHPKNPVPEAFRMKFAEYKGLNLPKVAEEILSYWKENQIFEKKKTVMSNILGKKVIKKNKNKVSFFNIRGNYPDKENRYMLLSNFAKTLRDKNIIKKQKIMKQNFDLMSICLSGIKSLQTNKEVKIKYLK